MEKSRRNFFKKGLAGTIALGAGSLMNPIQAMTVNVETRKAKRILMISFDGIRVDGLQQANTPNLDALFAEGSFSEKTRVVMPSVTLPNWTTHLTGSGPELHGVVNNDWRYGNFKLPAIETDKQGYYPSVFKVLKDNISDVKTAFYYNWVHLFHPYNKKYLDEVNYLENDAYVPNFEKALNFMKANRNHPTVVFLYTVHTDHAGHKYKWMSPEYLKSIEEGDAEVGRLLDAMKKEDLFDDTHFMFLTDHGGIGNGHGNVSPEEMIVPWGIVGPGIAKRKITEPNNTMNTAAVILRLFKIRQPDCWTAEVPESIFGK